LSIAYSFNIDELGSFSSSSHRATIFLLFDISIREISWVSDLLPKEEKYGKTYTIYIGKYASKLLECDGITYTSLKYRFTGRVIYKVAKLLKSLRESRVYVSKK